MYVSLVTETFPPDINGVATTLSQLHAALRARGHRVQVICPRAGGGRTLAEGFEVPGLALPFYREVRIGMPMGGRMGRSWQAERPDLVHIATEGPLGWVALRVARRLGIPVTSSLHTNFHAYARHYRAGWLTRPVMGYLRDFHNKTECTFIPTDQQAGEMRALGFKRLVVLGRGVDTELFSPDRRDAALRARWGVGGHTPVALHVGRLAPEKNLGLLIDSLIEMRWQQPDLAAVIVGDGPERHRLEQALPWVHFAGMQRGESLARHYASADLFVFPSKTETFGNVVLEAMASGLACLSFDYAAGNSLIDDRVNGRVVPVDDDGAFVIVARELLVPSVVQMGVRARETAVRHDWRAITERFERQLLSIVALNEQAEVA